MKFSLGSRVTAVIRCENHKVAIVSLNHIIYYVRLLECALQTDYVWFFHHIQYGAYYLLTL